MEVKPGTLRELAQMADGGSPVLLHAVGRAFGLGQNERDALMKGAVPGWFWMVLGLTAGFYAGVQAQQRWPEKIPNVFKKRGG
jgi:hypothetical protein